LLPGVSEDDRTDRALKMATSLEQVFTGHNDANNWHIYQYVDEEQTQIDFKMHGPAGELMCCVVAAVSVVACGGSLLCLLVEIASRQVSGSDVVLMLLFSVL